MIEVVDSMQMAGKIALASIAIIIFIRVIAKVVVKTFFEEKNKQNKHKNK